MATFVEQLVVENGLITSGTAAQVDSGSMVATGVTAGSYTNADITIDVAGRITTASNGSSSGGSGTITSIDTTAPIEGGPITTTGTISHATSGATAGSYTNADITIDTFGHITSASNGSGTTALNYGFTSQLTSNVVLTSNTTILSITLPNIGTYQLNYCLNSAPTTSTATDLRVSGYLYDSSAGVGVSQSQALSYFNSEDMQYVYCNKCVSKTMYYTTSLPNTIIVLQGTISSSSGGTAVATYDSLLSFLQIGSNYVSAVSVSMTDADTLPNHYINKTTQAEIDFRSQFEA